VKKSGHSGRITGTLRKSNFVQEVQKSRFGLILEFRSEREDEPKISISRRSEDFFLSSLRLHKMALKAKKMSSLTPDDSEVV
jgi:hypothetical protein